jgi:hypothetical protein
MSSIIFVLLLINSDGEIFAVVATGAAEDFENGFILDKNDCLGWGTVVGGTVIDALVVGFCGTVVGGTVIADGTDTVDSGLFLNILLKNDCFGCVFGSVGTVICGV